MCAWPIHGTRWCSQVLATAMSRTSTISSWSDSNTVVSTSHGSTPMPANTSAYIRATRAGVSISPSRSGFSPMARRISRTAAAIRCWSTGTGRTMSPTRLPGALGRPPRGRLLGGAVAGRPAVGRRSSAPAAVCAAIGGALQVGDVTRAEQRELVGRQNGRDVLRGTAPRALEDSHRPLRNRREDLGQLLLADGLLVEQAQHELVEDVAVLDEDLPRLVVAALDQGLDLLVDLLGDVFGVVALVAHVAAEEDLTLALPETDRAEGVAHAVLHDHRAGDLRCLLDVVRRAGGRLVEDELLGGAPAERVGEHVHHLAARLGVLVLLRQHEGVPEGAAARQDRHLVHGVGVGQRVSDQRVTALVVRRDLLFLVTHRPGLAHRAGDDAVDRLLQHHRGDLLRIGAGGQQRGLVDDVRQVSAGEARSAAGDYVEVDRRVERLALGVHAQ